MLAINFLHTLNNSQMGPPASTSGEAAFLVCPRANSICSHPLGARVLIKYRVKSFRFIFTIDLLVSEVVLGGIRCGGRATMPNNISNVLQFITIRNVLNVQKGITARLMCVVSEKWF